jgi:hypothetical protein
MRFLANETARKGAIHSFILSDFYICRNEIVVARKATIAVFIDDLSSLHLNGTKPENPVHLANFPLVLWTLESMEAMTGISRSTYGFVGVYPTGGTKDLNRLIVRIAVHIARQQLRVGLSISDGILANNARAILARNLTHMVQMRINYPEFPPRAAVF